jgi:hypothetical protein
MRKLQRRTNPGAIYELSTIRYCSACTETKKAIKKGVTCEVATFADVKEKLPEELYYSTG